MKKQNVHGFTLLESLVSLTLISIITLIVFTAFVKVDNERQKSDKLYAFILLDKFEYKIRENGTFNQELMDAFSQETESCHLFFSSEVEIKNDVQYLTLRIASKEDMSDPFQKTLILQANE